MELAIIMLRVLYFLLVLMIITLFGLKLAAVRGVGTVKEKDKAL